MESHETSSEEPLYAFDWTETGSPSSAVVLAVAEVDGAEPTALDPLYAAIDPDSLNGLFTTSPPPNGRVEFEYHGYRIDIEADGGGHVHERTGTDAPFERRVAPAEEYR